MAEKKHKRKQKRSAPKRTERRFEPESTRTSLSIAVVGMAGALCLGVGVYGQWLRDGLTPGAGPMEHAQWMVAVGAVVLAGALWFADAGAHAVRVGDAGLAIEKGSDLTRLAWCDLERVSIERGQLVAKGDATTLVIPVHSQPKAVAWILREAVQRVPDVLDVRESDRKGLPEPRAADGTEMKVENVQVAGRHCAASDRPIAFERDARFCTQCGEVYHKDHIPEVCTSCEAPLAGNAAAA